MLAFLHFCQLHIRRYLSVTGKTTSVGRSNKSLGQEEREGRRWRCQWGGRMSNLELSARDLEYIFDLHDLLQGIVYSIYSK